MALIVVNLSRRDLILLDKHEIAARLRALGVVRVLRVDQAFDADYVTIIGEANPCLTDDPEWL